MMKAALNNEHLDDELPQDNGPNEDTREDESYSSIPKKVKDKRSKR